MHPTAKLKANMPRYGSYQSLRRRQGITLVELVIGISIAGIIGLIVAGMFKAGMIAYRYSVRQNAILTAARKAFQGEGAHTGILWGTLAGAAIPVLSPSSLAVNPSAAPTITYSVTDGVLYRTQTGLPKELSKGITSLQVNYYGLDGTGRIIECAIASCASLVTTLITLQGPGKDKTYTFFSGTTLRNR